MHILIMVFSVASGPFHAEGLDGLLRVELSDSSYVEVIGEYLVSFSYTFNFDYGVEGVRLVRGSRSDTIFWLSSMPSEVFEQTSSAGITSLTEHRTFEFLVLDETFIGGLLRVSSTRNGRLTSHFTAFRTWLFDGTPLDLESIVQLDQLFFDALANSLGFGEECRLETELWSMGFWLDPQSFLLLKRPELPPVLRVGLPSAEGKDTLLIIDFEISSLTSATDAMMD